MRNREQYQDFLKCLSLFSEDIISKGELLNLVADSLSRHPDLAVQYSLQNLQHCWTFSNSCSYTLQSHGHMVLRVMPVSPSVHKKLGDCLWTEYLPVMPR